MKHGETFHLEVMDMERQWVSGEVVSLRLPASDGEIAILAHHEPMRILMAAGILTVRSQNQPDATYLVSGGVVEVLNNQVRVCADKWMHEKEMLNHPLFAKFSQEGRILKSSWGPQQSQQLQRLMAQLRAKGLEHYPRRGRP